MAYVLKGVNKKFLRPVKPQPDKQNLMITLPVELQRKYPSTNYGNIVVDNRNIAEVDNTTVDVTLYFDSYYVELSWNDKKHIKEKISSEQIYQQHVFMQLLSKEKTTTPNTPVYLRKVNKNIINKGNNDTNKYTLRIPIPERLQHLACRSTTGNIEDGYIEIRDEQNIIPNDTKNSYDICLPHPTYTIAIYDKNDVIRRFRITRGEIIESYKKHQARSASKSQQDNTMITEAESIASTVNNADILLHVNHKNISYMDDERAIISINVPESLKDKASTWWCELTVPASSIKKEGKFRNNHYSSVTLYQIEYPVRIPLTPTSNYHNDMQTDWEEYTVSRDELIAANNAHIQQQWKFFKDFDELVER